MRIYIDVYFFLNFILDYLSLFSVEKIMLVPSRISKKLISAFWGALYSCLILIIPLSFPISLLLHVGVLWFMVYIIFGKKKIGRTLAGIVAFIICEIIIGGAVVALGNLFSFAPKSTSKTIAIILFVGGCVTLIFPLFQSTVLRQL